MYIIKDWAGNRKFPDKNFETFDDAIAFLSEQFPNEEDRGEFDVVAEPVAPKKLSFVELGNIMLANSGTEACMKGYQTTDPEWVGRYALQFGDINSNGVLN